MLSPTALNNLKRKAKKLKKEKSISHIEALDILAKDEGYHSWSHLMKSNKKEVEDSE